MSQDDTHRGDSGFPGKEQEGRGHRGDASFPDDEQFTGNELDEDADGELQSIPCETNRQDSGRRHGGKRWLWPCVALGLCFAMGLGYWSMRRVKITAAPSEINKTLQQGLPVPRVQLIHFHSLVIPFHKSKDFTYLSFSISFCVPNNKVKEEMKRREVQLRGIIYDMLAQEINRSSGVAPLERLKELIIGGINGSLSEGAVREAYITRFLAV